MICIDNQKIVGFTFLKKKKTQPIEFKKMKMWAYFAPDGNIQVRSISPTRKIAREMISKWESVSYKDYERRGYSVHKIEVTVKLLK